MINYHLKMLEEIAKLGDTKPSLLLHVCCGPCSSNILFDLSKYFDITILYSNSNIYPKTEYDRRYQELLDFIKDASLDIKVIEIPYDNVSYMKELSKYSDKPEKSIRCHLCYKMRMSDAYVYASKNDFDYFTTVMSVSPHKNSQWINEIGTLLSDEKTKYLYSDFKKDNGFKKSLDKSSEYNLYRQNYCGCIYSYNEMKKRDSTNQND